MRTTLLTCITTLCLLASQAYSAEQHQHKSDKQTLTTDKEKTSYAVGVDLIRNFKRQAIDADLAALISGMQEEHDGRKLQLSEPEIKRILTSYQFELKNKQAQLRQQTAEKNLKEGKAFLEANKGKEGVTALPSGLQYKIITAGKGKQLAGDNDGVTVRYRGTLLDGSEFDSSENMGYPVTFFVKDSVIEGWKEALKLMPAGSKWRIFVPSALGYGEKGAGRDIGPNAMLIYEIELIAVNPQPVFQKKKETHDDNQRKQ
ncbi:MAG: FKBP-type peptidyl-prolyl cis-trans isomerase [Desulfuromonadales bacterium]